MAAFYESGHEDRPGGQKVTVRTTGLYAPEDIVELAYRVQRCAR